MQSQQKKSLFIIFFFLFSIIFISSCALDTAPIPGIKPKGVHELVFSQLPQLNPGDRFEATVRVTAKAPLSKEAYLELVVPKGVTLHKGNLKEPLKDLAMGQSVTYTYTLSTSQQGRYFLSAYLIEALEGGNMVTSAELPLQVGAVTQEQSSFREENGLYIQDLTPKK